MISEMEAARLAMKETCPGEPLIEVNPVDLVTIRDTENKPRHFLRSDRFIELAKIFSETEPLTVLAIREPDEIQTV